jgi:hypothetical protein
MNLGYSAISGSSNGVIFANGEIACGVNHEHVGSHPVDAISVFAAHWEFFQENLFISLDFNQLENPRRDKTGWLHVVPLEF